MKTTTIRGAAALMLTALLALVALPTSAAVMAPDEVQASQDPGDTADELEDKCDPGKVNACRCAGMMWCYEFGGPVPVDPFKCKPPCVKACDHAWVRCVRGGDTPVDTKRCDAEADQCEKRCDAPPGDDTCELKCNQGEDACRRTRPVETCQKEAAACRERCASYGPDPLPW